MGTAFKRRQENFTCGQCGAAVIGNGYTNHCPKCLYSQHVDESPGDRASTCGGLMEPVRLELVKDEYVITHRCLACGYEKPNRAAADDDLTLLLDGIG